MEFKGSSDRPIIVDDLTKRVFTHDEFEAILLRLSAYVGHAPSYENTMLNRLRKFWSGEPCFYLHNGIKGPFKIKKIIYASQYRPIFRGTFLILDDEKETRKNLSHFKTREDLPEILTNKIRPYLRNLGYRTESEVFNAMFDLLLTEELVKYEI